MLNAVFKFHLENIQELVNQKDEDKAHLTEEKVQLNEKLEHDKKIEMTKIISEQINSERKGNKYS
jgi:hypothetical protein